MKHCVSGLVFALLFITGCGRTSTSLGVSDSLVQESHILDVLKDQQAAWNSCNIDAFMAGYLRSKELRFASGGTVTRGWQQTSDRYHDRYSDCDKMGQLEFSELEVDQLSADAAIVHGHWLLTRAGDTPSGLFTLVFRKVDGNWLIVSDTTTSAGD